MPSWMQDYFQSYKTRNLKIFQVTWNGGFWTLDVHHISDLVSQSSHWTIWEQNTALWSELSRYSVFQHVLCINLKPHGAESQLHVPSKYLKRSLLLHGLFGSWPICFRCQTISMQPKIGSLSKCSYTWTLIPFILTQQLVGLLFTCTWSWTTKKMLRE